MRDEPDVELLKSLDEASQQSVRLLLDGLADHWSLDGLTHLVYGVPKVQAGFSADATPKELPAEIKTAQRAFFALLYHLLVGRDTGPRLPTPAAGGRPGPGAQAARRVAAREEGALFPEGPFSLSVRSPCPSGLHARQAMWSSCNSAVWRLVKRLTIRSASPLGSATPKVASTSSLN